MFYYNLNIFPFIMCWHSDSQPNCIQPFGHYRKPKRPATPWRSSCDDANIKRGRFTPKNKKKEAQLQPNGASTTWNCNSELFLFSLFTNAGNLGSTFYTVYRKVTVDVIVAFWRLVWSVFLLCPQALQSFKNILSWCWFGSIVSGVQQ